MELCHKERQLDEREEDLDREYDRLSEHQSELGQQAANQIQVINHI